MECRDVTGLFSDYYDGTLSAYKKEAVAKHLLTCKKCGLQYKTYRDALTYIKAVPDEQLPEEFYAGLDRKLEAAGKPWFYKVQMYLNMRGVTAGVLGVVIGLLAGVFVSSSLSIKSLAPGRGVETVSNKAVIAPAEKEKNTGRLMMRTGNVYKASYDLGRLVNRFDNAGLEAVEPAVDPSMPVIHKKYIITVNAGQYDDLVKQLNGMGYVMKLPDKKELAEIKKLKATDQIKFELEITQDGK